MTTYFLTVRLPLWQLKGGRPSRYRGGASVVRGVDPHVNEEEERPFYETSHEEAAEILLTLFRDEYGQSSEGWAAAPVFETVADEDLPLAKRVLYANKVSRVNNYVEEIYWQTYEVDDCEDLREESAKWHELAKWHEQARNWEAEWLKRCKGILTPDAAHGQGSIPAAREPDGEKAAYGAMTPEDLGILKALAKADTTQQQVEIAVAIERNPKTVRERLKILERAGLVERPCGERKGYSLTPRGLDTVKDIPA